MLNMSIVDTTKPWVRIHFLHEGKETSFYSAVNEMTGDRLTAFGSAAPTIGHTLKEVRTIIKNIKARSGGIISIEGTLK